MRFKIDWASLIVGSKFTVFAYIWRGDLTEGFFRYRLGGLIFGGAYSWRGLFSEFYDIAVWEMQVSWKTQTGYGKSSMCLLKALFKVYLAVVFFSLLYGAETWTIYHAYSKELSSMFI